MARDDAEITQLRAVAAQHRLLIATASALRDSTAVEEVLTLVTGPGAQAVGASGAGLALVEDDGVHVLTSDHFDVEVRTSITHLATDTPLPIVRAAVDGTAFFLTDRASADALFPGAGELYAAARTEGSAEVPLLVEGSSFGTLSFAFEHAHSWSAPERDLVHALGALASQALSRIRARAAERASAVRTESVLESMPVGYLAVDADWRFTQVNAEGRRLARPAGTGLAGTDLVGQRVWELLPPGLGTDHRDDYHRAVSTGRVVTFDAHHPAPSEAWYEVRAVPREGAGLELYVIDVTARRRAEQARDDAARRVAALGAMALAVTEAETVRDLVVAVAEAGVTALGADGGSIAVPDPAEPDVLVSSITENASDASGERVRVGFSRRHRDLRLPMCVAASTGERALYPDRRACLALGEQMREVMETSSCQAFAAVPMRASGQLVGVLTAGWAEPQPFDAEQLELLETLAAQCAQVLARLAARDAERAASAVVARFSETLQRSLLTAPPQPDHLQIEVRYLPATAQARVGGDWYDAFVSDDGATSVVIGDVTGHDQRAAAVMAQMRNLLRGIGYTAADAPAAVLRSLDRAVHALRVDGTATAVLARVELVEPVARTAAPGAPGRRVLRWSNAGHPPPLLLEPGRGARFLETPPDLLLGLDPDTDRSDHSVDLPPRATLLMYTDGLVERRGKSLDEGLAWLAEAAAALVERPLPEFCDELLHQVAGQAEDDVALLALRAYGDERRPAG